MAQDQLEEIKRKIDLIELINEYVPLKKIGRNFKVACPFHSESAPSFIVSPERQIWKCFGCGLGGDHFRFLMEMEGMEFGEALRILAKRAGVKLRSYRPSEGERQKQLLYEINHLASEYYHYLLLKHPVGKGALDYILGRGINKQSLQLFKLGFSPNSWDSLQKFLVNKKGYKVEDLEKAGLVIKKTGFYDRFRGRLMFPLKDHQSNVCGFAGRVLDPKQTEAKYVNSPETLVYHKSDLLYGLTETKQAIKKANEAILVEGELDLISSYQAGVENVVAIKGSALTERQIQVLGRFTKNITFALDQDLAGNAAAKRGIKVADAADMAIKVIEVKGGKDPDEVAQKDPKLWQKLVKESVSVYDYFFNSAFSRFDSRTAGGKREIGQELVPVLTEITNEIVRAHYTGELAERLAIDPAAVVAQIKKVSVFEKRSGRQNKPIFDPVEKETKSRRERLEEHLLALAFQAEKWDWLWRRKVNKLFKIGRFRGILEALDEYRKRFKTLASERLAKMLPAELLETFNKLYLIDLSDLIQDKEKLTQEWQKALFRLEKLDLKEQLKKVSMEIKRLENKREISQEEKGQQKKLDQEFRDLSNRLADLDQEK